MRSSGPVMVILAAIALPSIDARPVSAQVPNRVASLPPAEVEELDATSAAHLEQAKRFLAEEQWSEAVEAIRRVQEDGADRLMRVDLYQPLAGFERFVPASEYCQWRLAELATDAPLALAHYRSLVDPLAERWLRAGESTNDEALLQRIVDQAFASRYGDEALLKLGDLALARGDPAMARAAWQRISAAFAVPLSAADALRAPAGSPLWLALRQFDFANHGQGLRELLDSANRAPAGIYPDPHLERAAVLARLVLASIFEHSRQRATIELAALHSLDPEAEGKLGGIAGRYVDRLQSIWDESAHWPAERRPTDWPMFGGDATRGRSAARGVDPAGRQLWSYPLPRQSADREWSGEQLRSADDTKSLLAYHPVVLGQTVLLQVDAQSNSYIIALDLKTGRRLWQVDYSRGLAADSHDDEQPLEVSDAHADLARHLGVARHTLSVAGNRVFARVGSPVTVPSARRAATWLAKDQGFLVGVDLATGGKSLQGFPIRPASKEWTFEGSPLAAEGSLYLAMRHGGGSQSQLYLAAFELPTTAVGGATAGSDDDRSQGRLKWQTRICSAATLGGIELDELTHLLVTRGSGRLYLNTNAGVVAAVSAIDGRLLWLVKYPRAPARGTTATAAEQHWFRDLTPCLAWKDRLIVAPADCERIFALDSATGQLAWALPAGAADDVVHLLGVENDVLVASGDVLYWIDAYTGGVLTQFPRIEPGGAGQALHFPRGFGRGIMADGHIWWPTRESIFMFDAVPLHSAFGQRPHLAREIPLLPRGVSGGNLLLVGGVMLIATGDRLVAFGE